METPPNVTFFIELALLRLGKEISDGLDWRYRSQRVSQIVDHWRNMEAITQEAKVELLKCWHELLLDVLAREREQALRRNEGRSDTDDLRGEVSMCYIDFTQCVGNCLDALSI